MGTDANQPLKPITGAWVNKIRLAREVKQAKFQRDADEAMAFFNGPYDFLYGLKSAGSTRSFAYTGDEEGFTRPSFSMTHNRVAEMVQIFGPVLYHKNPVRQVNPRRVSSVDLTLLGNVQDPNVMMMAQQAMMTQQQQMSRDAARASLLEAYLNYTPAALDLKTESRYAIDEAIIKGAGCLSGGTRVYARIGGKDAVLRIRDLHRIHENKQEIRLWNGETWTRVLDTRVKERVGDELCLTLRSGEKINCTPNHLWPTGLGIMRADELRVGDTLSYVKIDDNKSSSPDHLGDEIGWFVGLYLGDGHIPKDKHDVAIGIAGHVDEVDRHERLEKIVHQYGGAITWKVTPGTKKCDATIYSRILVSVLREFINGDGAYKKNLARACWSRSDAFLRSLLDGYLAADGHWIEGEDIWRLGFCDNKALADDIRSLCARLGLKITMKRAAQRALTGRYAGTTTMIYRGNIRTRPPRKNNTKNPGEILAIGPANWRCDKFYDIAVADKPNTYALASGLLTHNCLWTEMYSPAGAGHMRMVGSFFDSVDNLFIDPDMETLGDAKWIARRCVHPYWEVEDQYGLPRDSLKGRSTLESFSKQAETAVDKDGDYNRKRGDTNDLIVYYKIFSKMGMGGRLSGIAPDMRDISDQYGPYVYLVVAEGVPYPLNLPPEVVETASEEDIQQRLAWPTPFWADDSWPFTMISFHTVPREIWPMSHVKPAIGELAFLNWAYSFLAQKVRTASRDFIAVAKSAGEELKDRIKTGGDYTFIEVDAMQRNINDVVQFLQHPTFNSEIYNVIEGVAKNFEQRVGLNELMYGMSSRQMRSAEEASIKSSQIAVRPDDMANKVEDAMTEVARKEALAARWHLTSDDVRPVLGDVGAYFWDQLVVASDPTEIIHQLEYRIEAGSTRKPNRDKLAADMGQAVQMLFQPLFNYASQSGNVGPVNALMTQWAKSMDFDASPFLLAAPPPPVSPQGGEAPTQGGNQ